jgi:hypothetical protein
MEVSGQLHAPAALPPLKESRYPLDRRLHMNIRIPSTIDIQEDTGKIKTSWMGERIVGEEETRWEKRRTTIETGELKVQGSSERAIRK